MTSRRTSSMPEQDEEVPDFVSAVIGGVMSILDNALVRSGDLVLTKSNIMEKAFARVLFEMYKLNGGKVREYASLKRHFTQVIAFRDAIWKFCDQKK